MVLGRPAISLSQQTCHDLPAGVSAGLDETGGVSQGLVERSDAELTTDMNTEPFVLGEERFPHTPNPSHSIFHSCFFFFGFSILKYSYDLIMLNQVRHKLVC